MYVCAYVFVKYIVPQASIVQRVHQYLVHTKAYFCFNKNMQIRKSKFVSKYEYWNLFIQDAQRSHLLFLLLSLFDSLEIYNIASFSNAAFLKIRKWKSRSRRVLWINISSLRNFFIKFDKYTYTYFSCKF